MEMVSVSRIVVVSSVCAAAVGAAGLAPQASNRAKPAADNPQAPAIFKNWRRLRPSRTPTLERAYFILFLPGAPSRVPVNSLSTGCRRRRGHDRDLRLKLGQKTPIRALFNDLSGGALHHANATQQQRVEPNCVFRVVLAPTVVRDILHR